MYKRINDCRFVDKVKNFISGDISSRSGSPGSKTSALIPALTSLGVIVIGVVALATVCVLKRKKKQRTARDLKKEEENPVYGMYYFADGRHIDEGRLEVVDNNDYYG